MECRSVTGIATELDPIQSTCLTFFFPLNRVKFNEEYPDAEPIAVGETA